MVEEGIMLIRITRRLTYSDKLRKYSAKQRKSLESLLIKLPRTFLIVRMKGLEPPRVFARQILSLLRLPFRHIRISNEVYSNTIYFGFQV